MEDGAKHTLVLYNCKVPQTGEVVFTAANAKCSANLKVKGELSLPHSTFLCRVLTHFPSTAMCLEIPSGSRFNFKSYHSSV